MPTSDVLAPSSKAGSPLLESDFSFTDNPVELDTAPPPTAFWSEVDRYQRLMERQLERDLSNGSRNAWSALASALAEQQSWHEHSRIEVHKLFTRADDLSQPLMSSAYRQAHLAGALADARIQLHLGTLTPSEFTAIECCLDALMADQEPPQAYRFMRLELIQGTHLAQWSGAVALRVIGPLTQLPAPSGVLMYRFGLDGGWRTYPSTEALLSEVSKALGALPDQQVTLRQTMEQAFEAALNERATELLRPDPPLSLTRAEREQLLIQALDDLTVPVNPARLLALAQIEEIRRSLRLGEEAQPWLARLSPETAGHLARLITDYAAAIAASDRLLRRDLPTRQAYASRMVSERLESDFGLTEPCRVRLKVPLRVIYVRDLIAGSGAPGTPSKRVPTASAETEVIDLETIAIGQIDDDLAERLNLMEVQLDPPSHPQREALIEGITLTWLRRLANELDVAGNYERLLADVHLRAGEFRTGEEEERTLVRPFALMLEMHWVTAFAQRDIDDRGRRMLIQACHAATPDAWNSSEFRLALRPAALTLFNEQVHSGGSVLAGVSFLEDQVSGITVLYLPQAPNGQTFKQYASLTRATEALVDLFLNERLRGYLCERAFEGNPRQLESLVNQALMRGFKNLIDARAPWPAHQSLARNQYLAELGLKVSAHRASSTSNADRLFDGAARSGSETAGYIRLALGFVPFLGSVIALVDTVQAGIELGHALSAGDNIAALEAADSVLLSITDVLLDFGPAALAGGLSAASLRATARARQLRHGLRGAGRLRQLSNWSVRRTNEAFHGYESSVRLTSRPGTEGRWRNVYQEGQSAFITRGSHAYAVEWDDSLRTWRLVPTRTRTYRQPIALDEAGNWQTHGHLYGSLVDGGLRGGGGIQSYVADRLDPLWPDPIRRLLPRWWTDAHFRRQQMLLSQYVAQGNAVIDSEAVLTRSLAAYKGNQGSLQTVVAHCEDVIAMSERFYQRAQDYRVLARGQRAATAALDQSRAAATICSKTQLEIELFFKESERLLELVTVQKARAQVLAQAIPEDATLSHSSIRAMKAKAEEIRGTLLDLLNQYDRIDQCLARLAIWKPRVTSHEHRAKLSRNNQLIERAFPKQPVVFLRVSLLLDSAPTHDFNLPSWIYMRRLYTPARERFDRVAIALFSSDEINLSATQRRRLNVQFKEQSQALSRTLRRLLVSYPDQFDTALTERLLEELYKLRDGVTIPRSQAPRQSTGRGPSRPRVFEGDGLLLVGEPVQGEADTLVIAGVNSQSERWRLNAQRQWEQASPPAPSPRPGSVGTLASNAEARLTELPAFRERLRRYPQQRILPADLEDLYLGESQELEYRIRQLREADTQHRHGNLIQRLQREADQLRLEGRLARIAQCKASVNPTGGQLDYLVEVDEMRIRKLGGLQRSGTSAATRNWLQEYEIIDSRTGQAWAYAHFHYGRENPRFNDFEAAHLKTPSQRLLATSQSGDTTIWRGEISRQLAGKLFQPLFN